MVASWRLSVPLLRAAASLCIIGALAATAIYSGGQASARLDHESRAAAGDDARAVASAPGATGGAEKYIHDASGPCDLGTFIKLMPCKKGVTSPACCHALRPIFAHKCACRPIPGIVMGHGGSALNFIKDYMRCNYTDDTATVAPVDYVADQHACVDQRSWCADPRPDVDVRLDAVDVGNLQIFDAALGWAHAAAPADDAGAALYLGQAACRALGYSDVRLKRGVPQAFTGTKEAQREVRCSAAAAAAGDISQCSVSPASGPALVLSCEGGSEPQLCTRATQLSSAHNHLRCTRAIEGRGMAVEGHVRSVGAAHVVCGSAGIDESKITWFDGWDDDFSAYSPVRDGPRVVGVEPSVHAPGQKDLLTLEERRQAAAAATGAAAGAAPLPLAAVDSPHAHLASHFLDMLTQAGYSDWRRR